MSHLHNACIALQDTTYVYFMQWSFVHRLSISLYLHVSLLFYQPSAELRLLKSAAPSLQLSTTEQKRERSIVLTFSRQPVNYCNYLQ